MFGWKTTKWLQGANEKKTVLENIVENCYCYCYCAITVSILF
jgi:hypothetical protein